MTPFASNTDPPLARSASHSAASSSASPLARAVAPVSNRRDHPLTCATASSSAWAYPLLAQCAHAVSCISTGRFRLSPFAIRHSSLLLAAHGAGDGSPTNRLVRRLARRIRALQLFENVAFAFHLGHPPFHTALDDLAADRLIVVPVMASDGYFCGDMLPRGLMANARIEEVDLTLTPPVGTHPAIADIALRRAAKIRRRFDLDPAETVLVLVGHGTRRIRQSIESTQRLRDALRAHLHAPPSVPDPPCAKPECLLPFASVEAAFLDAEPGIEFMPRRIPDRNLIVIPFLIGGGRHATHDLPRRLGLEPFPPGAASVSALACTSAASTICGASCVAARRRGRLIACTDPLGADPALLAIILDLATAGWPPAGCPAPSGGGGPIPRRVPAAAPGAMPARHGRIVTGKPARHPCPLPIRNPQPAIRNPRNPQRDTRSPRPGTRLLPVAAPLRLGTRRSALALWQARHVAERLGALGRAVDVVEITTAGDRDRDRPIHALDGPAPFADDIEAALRSGAIDLAVHSLKDLSVEPPGDLTIAAILPRGDARETLVSKKRIPLAGLPPGARVGTSSPRRAAQVRRLRPDLRVAPVRGPVDDRVRQVRRGDFDAIVLAAAGLQRLGLQHEVAEFFALERFVPAPAQAALAIQARAGDAGTIELLAALDHAPTRRAVTAELAFLRSFESTGPVAAAHAVVNGHVRLHARLLSSGGTVLWEAVFTGQDPRRIARDALRRAAGRAAPRAGMGAA